MKVGKKWVQVTGKLQGLFYHTLENSQSLPKAICRYSIKFLCLLKDLTYIFIRQKEVTNSLESMERSKKPMA